MIGKAEKPLSEAMKDLTGFELMGIEDHFHTTIDKMSGLRAMYGVVWALENRAEKTSWVAVKQLTLGEIENYFPEEDDMDDTPLSQTQEQSE